MAFIMIPVIMYPFLLVYGGCMQVNKIVSSFPPLPAATLGT